MSRSRIRSTLATMTLLTLVVLSGCNGTGTGQAPRCRESSWKALSGTDFGLISPEQLKDYVVSREGPLHDRPVVFLGMGKITGKGSIRLDGVTANPDRHEYVVTLLCDASRNVRVIGQKGLFAVLCG